MSQDFYWIIFVKRCVTGLRAGFAVLFCSIIVFITSASSWLEVSFFSAVMALIVTEESFGRTLRYCWNSAAGITTGAVAATIARSIFGASVEWMLISLFLGSFLLAVPKWESLSKKLSLAISGISLVAFAADPTIPFLFPLRLCGSAIVGCGCAIVAISIPWPEIATFEAREEAALAIRSLATLFQTLMEVFCMVDSKSVASARIFSEAVTKILKAKLKSLKGKEIDLKWEMGMSGTSKKLLTLIKGLELLLRHCEGMQLALESKVIVTSPPVLLKLLRKPVITLSKASSVALSHAADYFINKKGLVNTTRVIKEGEIALIEFEASLKRAREVAYYKVPLPGGSVDDSFLSGLENGTSERSTPSFMASQFFLFNACQFVVESLNLASDIHFDKKDRSKMHIVLSDYFNTNPDESSPEQAHAEGGEKIAVVCQVPECDSQEKDVKAEETPPTVSRSTLQLIWDLLKRLRVFLVDIDRLMSALKISVAMTGATLLGRQVSVQYSFWAAVTVAFLVGGYQGGSFKVSILRLQGTVFGAMYGYLALLVTSSSKVAISAALFPWVVASAFVRYSSSYGYAGVVSAFTAAIIMLGYPNSQQVVGDYALARITQTFLGVGTFILVELLVWPTRAVRLVRSEMQSCLHNCRSCTAAIVACYLDDKCSSCEEGAITKVTSLEESIAKSVAKQTGLANEASLEPDFWFPPFPHQVFTRLITCQSNIGQILFFMNCSLKAAMSDIRNEEMSQLIKPLREPLVALENDVLSSLDSLLEALSHRPGKRSKVKGFEPKTSDADDSAEETMEEAKKESRKHHVHPLLKLGSKWQSPICQLEDAESLHLSRGSARSTLDEFVERYEAVILGLIRSKHRHPEKDIVHNSVMLSFNSLVFSMQALIEEIDELESEVRELLQVEQPLDLGDLVAS